MQINAAAEDFLNGIRWMKSGLSDGLFAAKNFSAFIRVHLRLTPTLNVAFFAAYVSVAMFTGYCAWPKRHSGSAVASP